MKFFEYPYVIITILAMIFIVMGFVGLYFTVKSVRTAKGASEKGFSSIGKVSNDVISLILNRKKLDVYGIDYDTPDGTLIRDYISVQDVANAIVCAIDYNNSDIINIGSGVGYSVLEIIEIIETIVGIKVELNFLNKREIDQPFLIADVAKAIKKLGWKPTKDLVQIIKDTQNGLYL